MEEGREGNGDRDAADPGSGTEERGYKRGREFCFGGHEGGEAIDGDAHEQPADGHQHENRFGEANALDDDSGEKADEDEEERVGELEKGAEHEHQPGSRAENAQRKALTPGGEGQGCQDEPFAVKQDAIGEPVKQLPALGRGRGGQHTTGDLRGDQAAEGEGGKGSPSGFDAMRKGCFCQYVKDLQAHSTGPKRK